MQPEELSPLQYPVSRQHPEVHWDYSELQAIACGKALSRPPDLLRTSIPAILHSTTFDFPHTPETKKEGRVSLQRNCFPITVRPKKSTSPQSGRASYALKLDSTRGNRACSAHRNGTRGVQSYAKLYSPRPTFPVSKHIKKTQTSPYRLRTLTSHRDWLSPTRIATINLGCKLPEFVGSEEQEEGNPAPVPSVKDPELLERRIEVKGLAPKEPPREPGRINSLVKELMHPLRKLKKAKTIRDDSLSLSAWKVATPHNY